MSGQATLEPAPAAAPPPRGRIRVARRVRLLGLITGVLLAALVAGLLRWLPHQPANEATGDSNVPVAWQRPAVSAAHLPDRSGVKITEVAVTGGGGLVDLRYQVIDPDLAASLHDAATPPAVVDETSGLVVHDLLMSHSHSGPFKPGVTYYLIFNNPGNWVHRGGKVSVLLGNAQVEHVVVR
ncbi:MAG: hypothetical protein JWO57_2166 [Pseudonocardiales bacterium]|nr:hypothetical protein [Pseudonocardiales bacterium]